MSAYAILTVGVGAALGAWLRWALGGTLNSSLPMLPLGTLVANLLGGFLVGMAVEYFSRHANVPVEIRLLVITGFLGGLTTFSTFSAETVQLLLRAQYGWVSAIVLSHVCGSIAMTVLGIYTVRWAQA